MKAVVAYGFHDFRYEALPEPRPGQNEILVRVGAAGICAGDRMIYSGSAPWKLNFPFVPGHEFVGTVAELGAGAAERFGVQPGDHVTAELILTCGECAYCVRGLYHLCARAKHLGSDRPGGFAEYMLFPANARVWKVPPTLPFEQGVMIENVACAIHAVERGGIQLQDTVVVAGLGSIGAAIVAVAKLKTPRNLIALVTRDDAIPMALQLGATQAFNIRQQADVAGQIRAVSDGLGADVYLEASGNPDSIVLALDVLRKRGRLVAYGVYTRNASVDFNIISEFKELEIHGGHLSPNAYPLAIRYLSEGTVNGAQLVTHRFALSDYQAALEVKSNAAGPVLKTVLLP